MSVMIKGIEMPKYKGEHKNFDRYGCFLTVYKNGKVELHIFENDYTIEEIPTPHGRLIDADALQEDADSHPCFWKGAIDELMVRNAPTVIEAEVSE